MRPAPRRRRRCREARSLRRPHRRRRGVRRASGAGDAARHHAPRRGRGGDARGPAARSALAAPLHHRSPGGLAALRARSRTHATLPLRLCGGRGWRQCGGALVPQQTERLHTGCRWRNGASVRRPQGRGHPGGCRGGERTSFGRRSPLLAETSGEGTPHAVQAGQHRFRCPPAGSRPSGARWPRRRISAGSSRRRGALPSPTAGAGGSERTAGAPVEPTAAQVSADMNSGAAVPIGLRDRTGGSGG